MHVGNIKIVFLQRKEMQHNSFPRNIISYRVVFMKKFLSIILIFMAVVTTTQAQDNYPVYLVEDELPNGVEWLPEPPDTTSTQFVYDITQYMWGKSIRNTQRGVEATEHWVTSATEMAEFFSVPFGMTIPTFRLSVTKPKATFRRKRPYVRFNEPTSIPWDEERERNIGSYPSGHTIRGWGLALVLCEVNPDHQNDILKLGYEWGQSRVITGYHWQSDVNASRLMAAGVYARLHTCAEFMSDMAAAREEYQRLSEGQAAIMELRPTPSSSAQIYNINGVPASEKTNGIVIKNGEKVSQ